MLRAVGVLFTLLAGSAWPSGALVSQPHAVVVVLETAKGTIEIEVDLEHAPVTSGNFLRYVDGGFFDGGEFYRAVRPDTESRVDYPIQVVEARVASARVREGFPPIPLERTSLTRLTHRDGTVSMGRAAPDSATSSFFICLGDQPELDFGGRRNADGQGFAAFGRVIAGMAVVRAIQMAAVAPNGAPNARTPLSQNLAPPIAITKARRK